MRHRIPLLLAAVPARVRVFLPGVAFVLGDVVWRLVSWAFGFFPHPGGSMVMPAEGYRPWPLAAALVVLSGALLFRPSAGPAVALVGAEVVRLVETAYPLAVFAANEVSGWNFFDPAHPTPLSPWTELGHAVLHALAAVLLIAGLWRFRRFRAVERQLASAEDAF